MGWPPNEAADRLNGLYEKVWKVLGSDKFLIANVVVCWWAVSFAGIIINKTILSPRTGQPIEPIILSLVQSLCTVLYGWALQGASLRGCGAPEFVATMPVGVLRFSTSLLGLMSLRFLAASFTETIKSTSPFFTVIAAFLISGERTSWGVMVTLGMIVGGLVTASCAEASFTWLGFSCAIATTAVECIQNVCCKDLLRQDKYTASQLLFYSTLAALVVQVPLCALGVASGWVLLPQSSALLTLVINGTIYWAQTALVFHLMSRVSPVSISVLNTFKRGLIIFLSAIYFGNAICATARAGIFMTTLGGAAYTLLRSRPQQVAPAPESGHPGTSSSARPAQECCSRELQCRSRSRLPWTARLLGHKSLLYMSIIGGFRGSTVFGVHQRQVDARHREGRNLFRAPLPPQRGFSKAAHTWRRGSCAASRLKAKVQLAEEAWGPVVETTIVT